MRRRAESFFEAFGGMKTRSGEAEQQHALGPNKRSSRNQQPSRSRRTYASWM